MKKNHFWQFLFLLFSVFHLSAKPIQLKSYTVGGVHFTGYLPAAQRVFWSRNRPNCNMQQSLIVPAAYTHPDMSIAGASIEWGKIISPTISKEFNGFCVIKFSKPTIIPSSEISQSNLLLFSRAGDSVFQQDLLVIDGKIPSIVRAKRIDWWRALVIFQDRFEVVENVEKMRRDEFQSALQTIGAKQAINLDMGTWSEGAYVNSANRVVKIGRLRHNTRKQTNWLVFN